MDTTKDKRKMLAKIATSCAEEEVKDMSDFWIARANPFDPLFNRDKYFDKVFSKVVWNIILKLHPDIAYDDVDMAIRSGFLNAMQKEKEKRMKAMIWNPFGNKYQA